MSLRLGFVVDLFYTKSDRCVSKKELTHDRIHSRKIKENSVSKIRFA